jgi:predicted AAA+ superfamily ATPase
MLGFRLPPWTQRRNRRLIQTPKFYLFDVGIANYLSRRTPQPGTPEFGKSFEHYILMELVSYRAYRSPEMEIRYWRTSTGQEVDFILNDMEVAIEAKASPRVSDVAIRSLSALAGEGKVRRRILVCVEKQRRQISDSYGPILLLPWKDFLRDLWSGTLL